VWELYHSEAVSSNPTAEQYIGRTGCVLPKYRWDRV
jgi:hypothetical protein